MTEDIINIDSSKEEVANFFEKKFKIKEDVKNNFIKEDISADILYDLDDKEFKSLGLKVGPLKNIKVFLQNNKDHFKEKEIKEKITIKSKPNEVSEFFEKCLNFKGELNNMDGKGLIELKEEEIKNLGLNLGQRKKIIKYINYFKTLKIEEPEETKILITKESSEEEVSKYLKEKLNISDTAIESLGLDGESLFNLEETDIDEAEDLNQEEKTSLKNFIKELKEKKEEETKTKEETEIIIGKESSAEQVAKYLKEKLKISDTGIESLALDGDSLFNLEENDIDEADDLTQEEKDILKKFIKELKEKEPKKEIKITRESDKNEVSIFLKEKLKLSEKSIEDLELDGESLFSLEEKEIDESELTQEEKYNLKKFLKEEKEKNENNKDLAKDTDKNQDKDEGKNKDKNEDDKTDDKNIDKNEDDKTDDKNKKQQRPSQIQQNEKEIKDKQEKNKDDKNKEEKKENEKEPKKDGKDNTASKLRSQNKKKDEKGKNKEKIEDPLKNDNLEVLYNKEKGKKNKEYDGKQTKELETSSIKGYKIDPLIKDSKYNIFFILPIKEKDINELYLVTYRDESSFYKSSYIIYNFYFVNENNFQNTNNEKIKCLLVQIPLNEPLKKLIIIIENTYKDKEYKTEIEVNELMNFFYIDNINNFISINNNKIIKYYYDFFFEKNECERFRENLLKGLKSKISSNPSFELNVNNILKFFKFSAKYKLYPKNIENIDLKLEEKKYRQPLNEDICLSSDDIDILTLKNEKEKKKLIRLIILIYVNYDRNNLMKLIQSKNSKDCCRVLLDLLNDKELKLDDLNFEKQEDLDLLQKSLLLNSKTKEEINYIIKISEGLIKSLQFIEQNCKEICVILEKNASIFHWKATNYLLSLASPTLEDNVMEILKFLSNIIDLTKKKNYKIIDLEGIFEDLIDLYSNEPLNKLCDLQIIVPLLKTQKVKQRLIDDFYNKIHFKGVHLIKNGFLNTEEIIKFMTEQDIYYREPIYKNNENRDPKIFEYIPITDEDKDYMKNIELIKRYGLWNIFEHSNFNIQKEFYEVILKKMKKVRDFYSIFEIFPMKSINRDFTLLINGKMNELIFNVLDEEEEKKDLIYNILNNLLTVNFYNDLDLKYIIELVQVNYDFTSKYYFYLLKNENLEYIISKIKNIIISFFLQQKREGKANAESIISLLLLSTNNQFNLYLLN